MTKKRLPPGDDGHTIASMNVPGMPWYSDTEKTPQNPGEAPRNPPSALTRQETRWAMWGALKAALLVTAVFAAGIVVLVLLLLWMWK